MRSLLKGKGSFDWKDIHQEAFDWIKEAVTSAPFMSPLVAHEPLRLYLSVTEHAINGLIAQEIKGEELLVSYLSRVMKEAERRYSLQEKHCLAVVYAAENFRHYFQAHTMHIMSKSEGVKYMLRNASLTGHVSI
ncbi:hypothetical protein SESBI_26673 [Sesbania bispinosa]|nr:hypothetical protein SESBI_26673 [Sesbania bispinosa]